MQLKYGSDSFEAASLLIGVTMETVQNEAGVPVIKTRRLSASGYIYEDTQAALTTRINEIERFLSIPYRDLILYDDAGAISAHLLLNATSITGVRCVSGPNFPEKAGNEYVNQRSFNFVMEADYAIDSVTPLVRFRETLTISGGGPRFVVREAVEGPPVRQKVTESSGVIAVQAGEAVGFADWPILEEIAPPIFPEWLTGGDDNPRVTYVSPDQRGPNRINFGLSWEYRFHSVVPLNARPNAWRI